MDVKYWTTNVGLLLHIRKFRSRAHKNLGNNLLFGTLSNRAYNKYKQHIKQQHIENSCLTSLFKLAATQTANTNSKKQKKPCAYKNQGKKYTLSNSLKQSIY